MNAAEPGKRDIVVVGCGPAGSSAATFAAKAGRDVLVLERDRFPRFHIGESLLPESNALLSALGVLLKVQDEGFVVKRGASFWTEDGDRESYIDFSLSSEVREPRTFQVRRDRFDEILMQNTREAGAEVLEERRVENVEFDDTEVRVDYSDRSGQVTRVRASLLIDASGQRGFLARRLGLRESDPRLANVAEHSQFEGVRQLEGERFGDIRIISLRDMSWLWLIPLSREITSVGLVISAKRLAEMKAGSVAPLERALTEVASVRELFANARQVTETRRDADFSYRTTSYAGGRWLLAGDAGSFLDPVFSTGVLLALKSGREAALAAERALAKGDLSARGFASFDREQRRTYNFFRRMVAAFYDPAFRDVMFEPSNRWGLVEAMIATLAGRSRPGWLNRTRLQLLFLVVAAHRRFGIAERVHTDGGSV